jgi:hypothetical protein
MRRQLYGYCKIQKKVVPIEKMLVEVPASVAHNFIQDEMAPTRHPVDGKYYTSKAKFRTVTKAHGFEEVGTAYENGYDPGREEEASERRLARDIREQIKARLHGY